MRDSNRSLFRPGWPVQLVPAVLSVAVAFYLGSAHMAEIVPAGLSFSDKLGHFAAFACIQLTHFRAGRFVFPTASVGAVAWSAAASSSFFGGLLEVWQATLPHRTAEFADFVADTVGAVLMAICILLVFSVRRTKGRGRAEAES